MGQKHSSIPRKKLKPQYSKTECTEIVEFEYSDDVSEAKMEQSACSDKNATTSETSQEYPPELLKVIGRIDELETHINAMTGSQINLYFATLKDDLHNNWEKVYGIKNTSDAIKAKKIETIDKIKLMLKNLNDRFLKKKTSRGYNTNR